MTDTEMRIKIAEECGWKFTQGSDGEYHSYWPNGEHADSSFLECPTSLLPRWLTSLDAIQSAVLAQDVGFQQHFAIKLSMKFGERGYRHIHQLTARDWAEAFIETLKQLGRLR